MNEGQPPKIRTIYCIMCGKQGHVIRDCAKLKFFLGQGICRMDLNNRVMMSDVLHYHMQKEMEELQR